MGMDQFVPYVNTLGDDGVWHEMYYPNLKLTIERIKVCRMERCLSIEEFSELIRIDKYNLIEIEKGESLMGPSFLKSIADFYKKPIEYFLCNESENEQLTLF